MPRANQNQLDTRSYSCSECGIALAFMPDRSCLACPGCGREEAIGNSGQKPQSLSVRQRLEAREEIPDRPTAILPFRLTREQAMKKAEVWLSSEGLREGAQITLTEATYLPFILFRIDASASYTGQRSEYYTETTELRGLRDEQGYGQEQRETKKVAVPASGRIIRQRMAIPVSAFEKSPNDYATSLVDWNYDGLLLFDEAYMAGFAARPAKLNLREMYEQAKRNATGILKAIACDEIGGNEPEVLKINISFSQESFQSILIPVYTGTYTFKDEQRHFAVNGHTGEIKGHAPETFKKSLKKWLLYSGGATLLAAVYVLWMLINDYDFEEIIGFPVMLGVMAGAFLLFLWLQSRINIRLAVLVYVLASVSVVYLLWFVTESAFIVKGTGALLGVLSLFVLPMLFVRDKERPAESPSAKRKKRRKTA